MTDTTTSGEYRLLIGGRLVNGHGSMPVINPATGLAFVECPRASETQAEEAIQAAKKAFPQWAASAAGERQALLRELADAMEREHESLLRLLTQEQGKPLAESAFEVSAAIGFLRYFAAASPPAPKVLEVTRERRVEQHRRPLGVVAAITPWNFPVLLIAAKLGPALLSGNTVVLKPAPTTPLTAMRIGELCARIFPAGVVNVITDRNDLGAMLTNHPDVRKISFTGSSATGRKVMASAANTLKRMTLELGGNDAAIVLPDADPAQIAPALYAFAFMNCGQTCLAIKRLYVHDSLYDRMCEELAKLANAVVVGDGLNPNIQMGPLQNEQQFAKVRELLEDARERGNVIAGGEVLDGPGYFIRPTIVRDVTDGDRIVDEEQFGPVLPVIRYSDPDDALQRANASPMGLGGSIWGKDPQRLRDLAARMDAGTIWINKHLDFGPSIPLAGSKQSGVGIELAEEGLAEFTQSHVINMALG
ncbi:MAG: aldehyde dehydrogenase family protein [Proteobacteria bacterium]|nr:aldehyde dehydrogenase family protein [Pseudomonadota bacterium]